MKSKSVLLLLLILAGVGSILYIRQNSRVPATLEIVDTEKTISAEVPGELRQSSAPVPQSSLSKSEPETPVKDFAVKEVKAIPAPKAAVTVTDVDIYGRESSLESPSAVTAKNRLMQRTAIDPDKEFDSLVEADFNDPQTLMFGGDFEDRERLLQLGISFDKAAARISADSCIVTKEARSIQNAGREIVLKDDRSGNAALMIRNRWYLKLAYAFDPDRVLIGKLYERGPGGWTYRYDFAAQELHGKKVRCRSVSAR